MAQDDKYLLSKFRDKTLTLGDALTVDALTVKTVDKRTGIVEKPNTKRDSLKNSLIKAGYPMDTPYSVVNDSEFLKKLDSLGTNAPFRGETFESTTATAHVAASVFPGLEIQSITTRTEQTGAMPATKTVNTGFTVTLPYNAVGNITGGGENIYVSPMLRGIL